MKPGNSFIEQSKNAFIVLHDKNPWCVLVVISGLVICLKAATIRLTLLTARPPVNGSCVSAVESKVYDDGINSLLMVTNAGLGTQLVHIRIQCKRKDEIDTQY